MSECASTKERGGSLPIIACFKFLSLSSQFFFNQYNVFTILNESIVHCLYEIPLKPFQNPPESSEVLSCTALIYSILSCTALSYSILGGRESSLELPTHNINRSTATRHATDWLPFRIGIGHQWGIISPKSIVAGFLGFYTTR
jgi:hypothetical protein